jgi:DNA-binding transcriptional LysR family regulator
MDRFTSLSVFVAAVDQGSLTGAARSLGITPAMAGKHVAAVEADLGARLLHRTTRKLHLTDVGRAYYQSCRHILESLHDATQAARDLQAEPRGTLRITAPTTFGALHMGAPIAAFIRRYPGVTVEMSLEDRFVDLIAGGFDLAIRIGRLEDSSLIARRLAQSGMIACASPSYLAEKGHPLVPSDIARMDRLAFSQATSPGDWSFTDAAGYLHRVEGPIRFHADNMQMLLAAALAGAGIVYGPTFVFDRHLAEGTLIRVLPEYSTQNLGIHAVYPTARFVSATVRHFIDLLETWFADNARWDQHEQPI